MAMLTGPTWREVMEHRLPGVTSQMDHDAETFFTSDLPALLAWEFSAADAAKIACPVMHVGGTDSGPWFAQVREQILGWFPQAEDVVINGADHDLALTHAEAIADALCEFVHRHPLHPQNLQ